MEPLKNVFKRNKQKSNSSRKKPNTGTKSSNARHFAVLYEFRSI